MSKKTRSMYTRVETISPKRAKALLKRNNTEALHNRPLRMGLIQKLARDIVNGRWICSHQGIAIDAQGLIVDGQHRLHAIIVANRAVQISITYNVTRESMLVIDSGGIRKVQDHALFYADLQMRQKHTSTSRAMLDASLTYSGVTDQEVLAFYIAHKEAIDWAIGIFAEFRHIPYVTNAFAFAVCARAYYREPDRERIKQFVRVYCEGMPETAADNAAMVVREKLLRANNGMQSRREGYRMVEWALDRFLRRDGRVRRAGLATREMFLLPGEKLSKRKTDERQSKAAG